MAALHGFALDSSAAVAWLRREPGCEVVDAVLDQSLMDALIAAETLTVLLRRGLPERDAVRALAGMEVEIVPWTEELVWQGRDLCRLAWTHGLSLADRACLTTARALGRTALTADRSWPDAVRGLTPAVRVELIRKPR